MTRGKRRLAAVFLVLFAFWFIPYVCLKAAVLFTPIDRDAFDAAYEPSTRIYDRSGILLRELVNSEGSRANPVPSDPLPRALVDAVLSAEDSAFFWHGAVDWLSACRAFLSNARCGRTVSGASTVSMQLARIAYGHERDYRGKAAQILDAMRIEAAFSKKRILEEYLNRAPFAPGCTGAEAASFRYFRKSTSELEPQEAALLAGMIQAPTVFNPDVNPAGALARRNWVLGRMKATRRLSAAGYEAAVKSPLPAPAPRDPVRAGHFTDYVLSLSPPPGDVRTTLDWTLQRNVEQFVTEYVRRNSSNGLTNAAVVILDNATGAIECMVGSKEWSESGDGYFNGATALRQPGSTLKPFIYAHAFERGMTPATMLADIETEYISNERTLYIPRNYSRSWRGPVLAKEALASSLNIPAIRLTRELGVENCLRTLRSFGFASLSRPADYYGLGLVLGNGEVSLLELAGAYSVFARNGTYFPPSPFIGAREQTRILSEEHAFLITAILSDETMRVSAFGANTPLLVGYPVALKTGTSSNWRDSWTVGYTSEFTIAVWCGDFESSSMNQFTGSTGAGPVFNQVSAMMAERLGRLPALPKAPASVSKCLVCAESGLLPNEFCPRKIVVSLSEGMPDKKCGMHYQARVDVRTGAPAGPGTSPAYVKTRLAYDLPAEFDEWLKDSGKYSPPRNGAAGTGVGPLSIRIESPRQGDIYIVEPGYDRGTQSIQLSAVSARRTDYIDWYLDGALAVRAQWPYTASWKLERGFHTLTAKAGGAESAPVSFEVR